MRSKKEILEEQLENGEFIAEDYIYCPYCGYKHEDCYMCDSGETEYECEICEKTFFVDTQVSITYSTRRRDE